MIGDCFVTSVVVDGRLRLLLTGLLLASSLATAEAQIVEADPLRAEAFLIESDTEEINQASSGEVWP